jgi:hypothetical protein
LEIIDMKTPEDEAFEDIERRQGGGFPAKRQMAADKLWDRPSVAFDEWWNGDNDESTNPYRLESGAYWAWAGWKAALAQPAQDGKCGLCGEEQPFTGVCGGGKENPIALCFTPPAAQPTQEPVAEVSHWLSQCEIVARVMHGKSLTKGDTLYVGPPPRYHVFFPTMLRKMWSGSEVQAWLDENVNKEKNNG